MKQTKPTNNFDAFFRMKKNNASYLTENGIPEQTAEAISYLNSSAVFCLDADRMEITENNPIHGKLLFVQKLYQDYALGYMFRLIAGRYTKQEMNKKTVTCYYLVDTLWQFLDSLLTMQESGREIMEEWLNSQFNWLEEAFLCKEGYIIENN